MTFLALTGLHKSYGAAPALRGVDLNVAEGSRTAIVGASGSGKTTLLRIVAGFEVPDAGSVVMGGRHLADGPDAVPAHRRGIGYVPQDGALFPHLSVAENIGFGLARDTPGRAERISELLAMVALDGALLTRRPHELSGGQQQRVALARALAQRPRLMLLDEPFSALDTGLRAATRKAVAQLLGAAGITTILVTHDQAEALSFADQVAVMRAGRFAQVGSPVDLYRRPVDAATAAFLGEALVLPADLADGWADCALGRVPVEGRLRREGAQIMLRPEQLQLAAWPVDADPSAPPEGCVATVVERDFRGPESELTLAVQHPAGRCEVQVRGPTRVDAEPGTRLHVTVHGKAHVLG